MRALFSVPCPRCGRDGGWQVEWGLTKGQRLLVWCLYVESSLLGLIGILRDYWLVTVVGSVFLGLCLGVRWWHGHHRCRLCGLLVKFDPLGQARPWER